MSLTICGVYSGTIEKGEKAMLRKRKIPQDIIDNLSQGRKARKVTNREMKVNKDWKLKINADRYRLTIEAFKNEESQGEHVWGLAKEPTPEEEEENGPSRVVIFHTFIAKNGYQTHETLKRFRSKEEAKVWMNNYIDTLQVVLETDERITG